MGRFLIRAFEHLAPNTCHSIRQWRRSKRDLSRPASDAKSDLKMIPLLCDPMMTAVDVGASDGKYTSIMARYSRVVHAFEPNPVACASIKSLELVNVVVHELAISNECGEATLHVPLISDGLATIEASNPWRSCYNGVDIFRVPIQPLDAFGLKDLAFLKIDVEGHELSVLRGAQQTITKNRPALLIEIEERHSDNSIEETVDYLTSTGYRCFYLDNGSLRDFTTFLRWRDQDVSHLSADGVRKHGRYINNFVFVCKRHLPRLTDVFRIDYG